MDKKDGSLENRRVSLGHGQVNGEHSIRAQASPDEFVGSDRGT